MSTPHTMEAQLKAALERAQDLEIDLHAAKVEKLLAERRARIATEQGGERYARNLPNPWAHDMADVDLAFKADRGGR